MKRLWKWLVVCVLLLPGCLLFGPEVKGMPEKIFGVLNTFPEHPEYAGVKNADSDRSAHPIAVISVREQVLGQVCQYLEDRGYKAVAVNGEHALAQTDGVDILIRILPFQSDPKIPVCGFTGGSPDRPPASHVGLQLELRRKHSARVILTLPVSRRSGLEDLRLPGAWDDLSDDDREALEESLRENLAKALYLSLARLKI